MNYVKARNPHELEFLQAVQEVTEAIIPFIKKYPKAKFFKEEKPWSIKCANIAGFVKVADAMLDQGVV